MKDFAAIDFETANECRSSVCSVVVAACGYDLTAHHHALADADACDHIAIKPLEL